MTPTPDLEGYEEAQANLRAQLGQVVPFFIPTATVWPPGVPLDAAGEPIDPSIPPLASGYASAAVTCSVANRPIRGQGMLIPQTEDVAIGIASHSMLLLIMSKAEFDDNGIDAATQCEVFGKRYKIEAVQPDQVGPGPVQRMQIFVERM
jgi:hypothetical protein